MCKRPGGQDGDRPGRCGFTGQGGSVAWEGQVGEVGVNEARGHEVKAEGAGHSS